MLRFVEEHLGSTQDARVIYGANIGLALVVALEHQPPRPGVVVATLLGTALAVALAELYSEVVGAEIRFRRRIDHPRLREIGRDVAAVAFGISFPGVFFVLAAAGAMEVETAFELAKWTGLALVGFYGFIAARLAGLGLGRSLAQGAAVALIGGFLIGLKAFVH